MANSTIMTFSVHSTGSGVAKGGRLGCSVVADVNANGYCSQTGSCVAKKCAARSINGFNPLYPFSSLHPFSFSSSGGMGIYAHIVSRFLFRFLLFVYSAFVAMSD